MNPMHSQVDMKKLHGQMMTTDAIAHQGGSKFRNVPMTHAMMMDAPQKPGLGQGFSKKFNVKVRQQS